MEAELPIGENYKALETPHFPTKYQAVVWRNWELVPVERLACVLKTSQKIILDTARGMGLRTPPIVDKKWLKRGYITIIRANWHLLPYGQLLGLLGWTADKLAYTLKEDDFLYIKLGSFKPKVEPVFYRPLSYDEKRRTEELRQLVFRHFPDINKKDTARPFDFLKLISEKDKISQKDFIPCSSNEIVLDDSWSIVYTKTTENIEAFTNRFASYIDEMWGINLSTSKEPSGKKRITLSIKPEPGLLPESHTVDVTSGEIKITAVDEVGLLRGLQWIEKDMEQRKGPYLKRGKVTRRTRFDLRLIYSYFAVYGDPFLELETDPYPDELLLQLSRLGINGIWLQGILYSLIPWEEAPELSTGWEKRLKGLKKLVDRAADFGIGVYLYLNEPRAMPVKFFKKHPQLKGFIDGETAALCTSRKPVQDYLRNSTARLFKEVPGLSGVITITMSENITNCYSKAPQGKTNCPYCAERRPHEVVAEVNRLIAEGVHSVKPEARVICWTWGWNEMWGWNRQMVRDAIALLPDDVSVMCVSEDDMHTEIGGVHGRVLDYSMSVVGPSEKSIDSWKYAAKRGLKTVAKVQFNNSWECSAVPYLPVMDLVEQHLGNLLNAGVNGLMLGWTLGGYPSLTLELASQYYWEDEDNGFTDSLELAKRRFGDKACMKIKEAWSIFSEAFREFPFNLDVLYLAPQNFGPMNLLHEKCTGLKASMIGFPYDDIEGWRGIYPTDIFAGQFKKLSEGWKHGIDILEELGKESDVHNSKSFIELRNIAVSVYYHFRSTCLQIEFIRMRDALYCTKDEKKSKEKKQSIIDIIDEEIEIAEKLIDIVFQDSRIGFEASNHYYYTRQDLMEKVINCEYLRKKFLPEQSI